MEVHVDMELCQHYGQCVFAAPEVFQLDDNGKLVYEPNPDGSVHEAVTEAIDACPMQAISLKANVGS